MDNTKGYFKLQVRDSISSRSVPFAIDGEEQESVLQGVKLYEYLLMFLLLALSGNPFFTQKLPIIVTLAASIPVYYILRNPGKNIAHRTLFIFLFFIGYELLHAIMFQLDYTLTIIKLSLVLLLAFSVVNILKDRFIKVLVATMFYISIVSFVFTILCYVPGIGKPLFHFAAGLIPLKQDANGFVTPTLIMYTFFPDYFNGLFSYVRNAGIFWEGGAFAVFLNVTLFLYYASKQIYTLRDMFDKVSIVLIMAVLTTVSTMGFVALALILTFYSLQLESNIKYVFLLMCCVSFYVAYHSFEFLGSKIDQQLAKSAQINNRFGSALLDISDIMERPVFGWSRRLEVLFDSRSMAKSHRPNGLTNFLRNYGFLYVGVYFYLVFASFRKIGEYYDKRAVRLAIFGILLLCIVSFSELIFDAALFKSLVFLFFAYYPKEELDGMEEVS